MDVMSMRRLLIGMITHTSSGDAIPAGCEIGVFVPTTDELTHTVQHNLGEIPKFAIVVAVGNCAWSDYPNNGKAIIFEDLMSSPATGFFDRSYSGATKRDDVVSLYNDASATYSTNTWTTYPASMTSTEVTFATGRYYNGMFSQGMTYLYVLTK